MGVDTSVFDSKSQICLEQLFLREVELQLVKSSKQDPIVSLERD